MNMKTGVLQTVGTLMGLVHVFCRLSLLLLLPLLRRMGGSKGMERKWTLLDTERSDKS